MCRRAPATACAPPRTRHRPRRPCASSRAAGAAGPTRSRSAWSSRFASSDPAFLGLPLQEVAHTRYIRLVLGNARRTLEARARGRLRRGALARELVGEAVFLRGRDARGGSRVVRPPALPPGT